MVENEGECVIIFNNDNNYCKVCIYIKVSGQEENAQENALKSFRFYLQLSKKWQPKMDGSLKGKTGKY